MKKLITILNLEIPSGRALNASAHTVLGMGHRVPESKMPNIYVFLGTKDLMREFRSAAYKIYVDNTESVLYADFTSTMVGGTTDEQLLKTSNTQESEIEYYSVSICADDVMLRVLEPILVKLTLLENYNPQINSSTESIFEFLPKSELLDNHDPRYTEYSTHKAVLVFNKKQNIDEIVNPMVVACLDVGQRAKLMALHLLRYVDASGSEHPNISYHAFPILTAKNQGKLDTIAFEVKDNKDVISRTVSGVADTVSVVCAFGEAAIINSYTKQFSLWTREITQEECLK